MKISTLHILTNDLPGTRSFYAGQLGLHLADEDEHHLSFQLRDTLIVFHKSDLRAFYHIAFTIPANQVREAEKWIRSRTSVPPVSEGNNIADFSNWEAEAVYFFDHNGSVLELIARRPLKNESILPFDGSSLLGVSEIGWVTDDVADTCAWIRKTFGTPFFFRQPALPSFAAMGDDCGLFIVVPERRSWYPTKVLSEKHWFRVEWTEGDAIFDYEHHA